MEVKTGKELKEAVDYQRIEKQRENFANEDCITVVTHNEVHAIGWKQEFNSCIEFIESELADDPDYLMKKGQFTDAQGMYSYLFENCNDEQELTSFLCDYYDGMEMENYGKE